MDLSEYNQLLVELELCEIGGLILCLYKELETIDIIVNKLQYDLPGHFQFCLPITEYKTVFPIFFSQTFEPLGNFPVIFHITGLHNLKENLLDNFILNLQNNREAFKKKPYIIVFWIKKEVERKLFYLAPDFFHWLSSSYDFSNFHNQALENNILQLSLYIESIKYYLESVVWQFDNWDETKKNNVQFKIESMDKYDINKDFIRIYGKTKNSEKKNLDYIFQEFLENREKNFLALLGDFGTGKSSFAINSFIRCSKQFLKNSNNLIPIFINLKNYSGKIDFREFIIKECFEKFNYPVLMVLFQELICKGRFLFILDGFDEILNNTLTDNKLENFLEINKLTFDNMNFLLSTKISDRMNNKVFLTSRTHYFFTESQEKEIFTKNYASLYRNIATKNKIAIERVYFELFDQDQIKLYLKKKLNNPYKEKETFRVIRTVYNLLELANRPLLLGMIIETLPFISDFKNFNACSLYQIYINQCLNRDNSSLNINKKREWLHYLAIQLFFESKDGVLIEKLANEISTQFGSENFNNLCVEIATRSFLVRNKNGRYYFSHKSFMEYFIAEYEFFRILSRKESKLNRRHFNTEIFYFLGGLIESSKNKNFSNCDFSNLRLEGLELINFDLSSCIFSNFSFSESILSHCNINNAVFKNGKFFEIIFKECNFRECYMEYINFKNTYFNNINTEEMKFFRCNFDYQNFIGFSFENLDISWCSFKSGNLVGCNFKQAIGKFSNFIEANIQGGNFICADFSHANFSGANLKNADFGWSNLTSAIFSYSDLTSANLGASVANWSRFDHCQLSKANLEAGQFANATFENSNLKFAQTSNETVKIGTNFLGANLTGTSLNGAVDTHNLPDWLHFARSGYV